SNKKMIKRVIAIGTDVIKGENKNIYLNGQMIHEPYVQHTRDETVTELDNFGPVTVPEDALFVMGDNRDESFDSRFFGVVSLDKVEGKAICVQWSKKSNRNGSRIH
ncbi:MAG: signal peptidase I, partial [Aliifodinibius sp.]|nr:signal peptidase I [Fodinibius sp.]NIW50344.1 signal peptidase I [Gammaproteobacteria bacterium]NIW96744.1 signal peptidase I [Phycisphaerae bacterium]NIY30490.1 signal peptidase I [Fodinibius sp.]